MFLDLAIEHYNCKIKLSQNNSFSEAVLAIYNNYILFCSIINDNTNNNSNKNRNSETYATINYKYSIRNIEVHTDRSNTRLLCMLVKQNSSYKDIYLEFNDYSEIKKFKQFLEDTRKSVKNNEYLLLDTYIDDLLNKWNY